MSDNRQNTMRNIQLSVSVLVPEYPDQVISDHQLGVWGWSLDGAGTTLCWWSLISEKNFCSNLVFVIIACSEILTRLF
jgi:hypothetical protein